MNFWLTITFGTIFLVLSKFILPRISKNLEQRRLQILENIETAEKQREQSEKNLKEFDEIILIGSGKGVASVKTIDQIQWKRKGLKFYNIFLNHYKYAIKKCRKYQ